MVVGQRLSSDQPIHANVDSLNVMYGRAALRAAIIKEGFIPGLNQDRILNFSDPTVRSQKPLYPECEKKGSWKCAPRKKRLIGSAEKMLTISVCDEIYTVDWSCNDTIAVGFDIMVEIHKCKNGVMLSSYTAESPYKNYIKTIKFSNDGSKLAMHFRSSYISTLMLHDLENKFLWDTFCKCFVETVNYCTVICICWSAYDRHILTGCTCGKISAYASDTGKCLWSKLVHTAPILVLSFSPNFKYLVSSGKDKIVRIFSWPELIPCFDVEFFKIVEAVAWHPHVSGLLCIGGGRNGSLSLWNVNNATMTAYVTPKFNGHVKNLAWNKLSGELVVHWTYREGNKRYTIVPVLASFNRIVDVLPLDNKINFLRFNATHDQLITCSGTVFSIWNFFGNEKPIQERCVPLYNSTRWRQGVIVHNPIR
ncbi:hypothetical protein P5V15_012304 [Pogonomyrmex californicus]